MKIFFFYQYFGTPKGSWSTRIYELCKRWVADGHNVTVVTAPYDKSDIKANKFISKQGIDGINLIVINSGDSNRFSKLKRVIRAITFSIVSVWYSLTKKYDVCIASSGPITIGIPMIFAKVIRRKKCIFEVRDLWPAGGIEMGLIRHGWQQNLALWFEKLCYKYSNVIVTASIGQKDHIKKRFPKLTVEVIPNASDIEVFGNEVIEDLPYQFSGKKLFTHIGSLGLIHNTKYWLRVAEELALIDKRHIVELIFIGDGKDRMELEDIKLKRNIENIHFLGLKPKRDLPLWVQNSTATLFATLDNVVQNACSPNKIFDSFAAGVPIVQTSTGWIMDLVENEKCGINVPLSDPGAAAREILYLAENPVVASQLGKNALRLAETDFNRDSLAYEYLSIIKRIINGE